MRIISHNGSMQVPLTQYACVTATESRPEDFASVLQLSLALMSLYIKQECVEYCETSPTVQRRSVKYSQVTQKKISPQTQDRTYFIDSDCAVRDQFYLLQIGNHLDVCTLSSHSLYFSCCLLFYPKVSCFTHSNLTSLGSTSTMAGS